MPSTDENRGLAAYLLFTFGFSAIFYSLIATGGGGDWVDYTGCLMWCPALGALTACAYLGRSVSTIAWRWGDSRWEIACYLIPLGYAIIIYVPTWVTGIGKFYSKPFLDLVSQGLWLRSPRVGEYRPVLLFHGYHRGHQGFRYCSRGRDRLARFPGA